MSFAKNADIQLPDATTIQKLYDKYDLRLKTDDGQNSTWAIKKNGSSPGKNLRNIIEFLNAF